MVNPDKFDSEPKVFAKKMKALKMTQTKCAMRIFDKNWKAIFDYT